MQPLVKRSQENYQIARICFLLDLLTCDFYWASLFTATPSAEKIGDGVIFYSILLR